MLEKLKDFCRRIFRAVERVVAWMQGPTKPMRYHGVSVEDCYPHLHFIQAPYDQQHNTRGALWADFARYTHETSRQHQQRLEQWRTQAALCEGGPLFYMQAHGYQSFRHFSLPGRDTLYTPGDLSIPYIHWSAAGTSPGMDAIAISLGYTRRPFKGARTIPGAWHAYHPEDTMPDLSLGRIFSEEVGACSQAQELHSFAQYLLQEGSWRYMPASDTHASKRVRVFDFTQSSGDPSACLLLKSGGILEGKSLFHYMKAAYMAPKKCLKAFGEPLLFVSAKLHLATLLAQSTHLSHLARFLQHRFPRTPFELFVESCNFKEYEQHQNLYTFSPDALKHEYNSSSQHSSALASRPPSFLPLSVIRAQCIRHNGKAKLKQAWGIQARPA